MSARYDDQFIVKAAHTIKEATELAEVGFEPFNVVEGVHLYRKRK